ncbi:hypothetical protein K8Q96_01465, partial [Candidatus Nomurabacteria bacterium]|nr:hypothetical protein [Candidatus Nomurabacteria bacterium]
MKKIAYIMVLGFLFLGSASQAIAAWNTYPSDCPLPLSIGNYSTGYGIQDGSNGCWTKTSVTASAGQTINIAVYYDNTNNTAANNTVIQLTQSPAGSMSTANSSYAFSGSLNSSAGSLNLSQVTASLSSSQTLTFSQAKWYKAGSLSSTALPNGQTGYEAFGGGLNMGTIANGDWGTVLMSFTVGTTVTPPPVVNCTISNFTANPTSISANGSSTLSWNTSNCTSVSISGIGNVATSGSQVVYPSTTTTYTLTAYGQNGTSQTRTVTVTVASYVPPVQNCTISNFTANPTSISANDSSTLSWNTSNCISVTISNLGYNVPVSGNQVIYPTQTTTYLLTAYGSNWAEQTRSVTATVASYVPPVQNCTISNFTANPTQLSGGGQ